MTESKLFRWVAIACTSSLLLPLIIATTAGNDGKATQKLQQYLKIADSSVKDTAAVKLTEVKEGDKTPTDPNANQAAPTTNSNEPAKQPTTTTQTPAGTAKPKSEYVVKEGDTYGCIAEKYYGSFEHYTDVMRANAAGVVPGYSEYRLNVGAKLQLPAVAAGDLKPASSLCK